MYNCIGYAAGRTDAYWWPDDYPEPDSDYWPAGIPREETLEAFTALYESLGYAVCGDGSPEKGFEKVAIYVKDGKPTHAARQLANGHWTSKLGPMQDIRHETPEAVSGPCYGNAARFLRRKAATALASETDQPVAEKKPVVTQPKPPVHRRTTDRKPAS